MMEKSFLEEVRERSGQDIGGCYQCLKCSVGCPISRHFDYQPNSLIRLIQYGDREKVLTSHAIWLCVSCMTCGTRCPNEVDMSTIMDTLREMAMESEAAYKVEKNVILIHEEFIRSIRLWGRLHEVSFYIVYMLRSFDFFAPIPSGIALMARRKLPFIPRWIKGIKEVRELYRKVYGEERKAEEKE